MGPVLRTLPIADRFRQAGYTIAFSIYDDKAAAYIQSRGYLYFPDDDPTLPDPLKVAPRSPVFYHLDHYFAQNGLLDVKFTRSWIRHRVKMLRQYKADLVFADMSPHTVIAAKYLGIPTVSVTQSCFIPDGLRLRHWEDTPRNTPVVTPVVNQVLTELGLTQITCMEQLNRGDVTIIPGIPELDPVKNGAAHYVGPLDTEGILHSVPLNQPPYIVAYAGRLEDTSGSSGAEFVRMLADAFRDGMEQMIIACSGNVGSLADELPPSIRFIDSYSASRLAHSRLFIHHGGHGSCYSSIMAGVPSIIIPTHTEREFNARRMAECGLAEYVMPRTFSHAQLRQLAQDVMNGDYRYGVQRICTEIIGRHYQGAEAAYRLGVSLLAKEFC